MLCFATIIISGSNISQLSNHFLPKYCQTCGNYVLEGFNKACTYQLTRLDFNLVSFSLRVYFKFLNEFHNFYIKVVVLHLYTHKYRQQPEYSKIPSFKKLHTKQNVGKGQKSSFLQKSRTAVATQARTSFLICTCKYNDDSFWMIIFYFNKKVQFVPKFIGVKF